MEISIVGNFGFFIRFSIKLEISVIGKFGFLVLFSVKLEIECFKSVLSASQLRAGRTNLLHTKTG